MIDEIMCCLLAYSATYPQYPLEQLKIAAEQILKMQEEKGMLPPSNGKLTTNYTDMGLMDDHSWEPEE